MAVGSGAHHLRASSAREALHSTAQHSVRAVLISPSIAGKDQDGQLIKLLRRVPGIPSMVVIVDDEERVSEQLLNIGFCGIRSAVHLSDSAGWRRLRDVVSIEEFTSTDVIRRNVLDALSDATNGSRLFFGELIRRAPRIAAARLLAAELAVQPSTLLSRFFRARLPSPKSYLAHVRLIYAAALLESPNVSVSSVATQLHYSSSQMFCRHVRDTLGIPTSEFRERHTLHSSLDLFLRELVVPHWKVFAHFDPLSDSRSGR
jgi:AraC-like DNA-binding protein